MEYVNLILYLVFGIVPSLIWLFYYLAKDMHPEPKKMIAKVFLLGALATVPALLLQILFSEALNQFQYLSALYSPELYPFLPYVVPVVKWFFVIALTEELCKYLVVRLFVFNNNALDEPMDIMVYMVVAALGFAALENVLYLFSPIEGLTFGMMLKTTLAISFIRFVGATFLHTLCSALVGYFLALASLRGHKRFRLAVLGLSLAVLLHGLYDFSIIALQRPLNSLVPVVVVVVLALFMIYDFDEIKKVKSICKI